MASIQRKGRNWYCQFYYFGDRHTFTIGRVSEDEAHAKSAQVDYLLMRLRQRLIELPPGVDIVAFVQYDGKPPASSIAPVDAPSRQRLTLAALRDRYLATHEHAKETNTLTDEEREELWECLFLTFPEIAELLQYVESAARHASIFPMVSFCAHTGARRAEMLRARIDDLDFEGETVLIREMKREKGRRTTRRAPLSPFLAGVLRQWLTEHAGGQYLFCHDVEVARSRKRSATTGHRGEKAGGTSLKARLSGVRSRERQPVGPLTADEAHDHLKRTLAGSKWEVMRGWHVLRHNFISCCAAAGVDQRLIDEWVGHDRGDA
jgi:integrase